MSSLFSRHSLRHNKETPFLRFREAPIGALQSGKMEGKTSFLDKASVYQGKSRISLPPPGVSFAVYPEEARFYLRDMRMTLLDLVEEHVINSRLVFPMPRKRFLRMLAQDMYKPCPLKGGDIFPDVHVFTTHDISYGLVALQVFLNFKEIQNSVGRCFEIVKLRHILNLEQKLKSNDFCWNVLMGNYYRHVISTERAWTPSLPMIQDAKLCRRPSPHFVRHASLLLLGPMSKGNCPCTECSLGVLTVWCQKKRKWTLPGGAVDRALDKNPYDTAQRESQEELNPSQNEEWSTLSEEYSDMVRFDIRNQWNFNRPCEAVFVARLRSCLHTEILNAQHMFGYLRIAVPENCAYPDSAPEVLQEVHAGKRKLVECTTCCFFSLAQLTNKATRKQFDTSLKRAATFFEEISEIPKCTSMVDNALKKRTDMLPRTFDKNMPAESA